MFIRKHRIPIIVTLLIVTVFMAFGLKRLTKESGIESLIPTTNEDYKFFKEMEEEFGYTDQIVIGLRFHDSVYKKENILIVQEITEYIGEDENIDEDDITSITTIDSIDGIDQEIVIAPLVPEDEELDEIHILSLKKKVEENQMFRGKIVSKDEKSTPIIITVNSDISMDGLLVESVIKRIQLKLDQISEERDDITIYRSGMVSVKHITSEYMEKDISTMFPIAIIVVIAVLGLLLRSFSGIIIPILVTLFSIIWTLGLKGWLNSPLTISETAIPVMLIAIGCADGVHIVSEFIYLIRTGLSSKEAVSKTMKHLRLPVILTSITTSLGFFSLIVAPGVSIKNMGVFLGFGVMTAMLFSLLFIPALLTFKKSRIVKNRRESDLIDISKVGELIIKNRYIIIISSLLFLVLSFTGMKNVVVETDQIKFLKDSDPIKMGTKELQRDLGGVNTLDIILTGEENSFKSPVNLVFLEELEEYVNSKGIVGYTLSINDYLKKIYYEFNNKNQEYYRIPYLTEKIEGEEIKGEDVISNLLFLYEMGGGDTINKVVTSDYSRTKLSIRLKETSQVEIENLRDELDIWINNNLPSQIDYRYSNDYIRIVMGKLVTESQIKSFISTLIAIIILLMIIFRSPLSGFLTSLPVVIAVSLNFGIMWVTGTTLNIGTSIIASVGMGVGIDYAIHFFQRYKINYREMDNRRAIISTINECSKPILTNALAVGLGFLALLFSNYFIIVEMGWITGVSMLTTAIGALFILPAYLAVFEPLKKKKERGMKKGLIALVLMALSTTLGADEAYNIVSRSYDLKKADTSYSLSTMVLIDKKGKKKTRQMENYSLETEIGKNQYISFTLPADVKGTKFLTIGDDSGDDEQRIYLPALKKVRKISSSNKKGKFMGSDITYYDMDNKNIDDYNYKLIGEESLDSGECYIIESTPIKKDAPYGKTHIYVNKDDNFIYKRDFFDKRDKLIKTMVVVEVDIIDGVIVPIKTVVDNYKDKHKTLLAISDIELNVDLDPSIFTIQNLK